MVSKGGGIERIETKPGRDAMAWKGGGIYEAVGRAGGRECEVAGRAVVGLAPS